MLASAQEDFRTHDRDGDGRRAYWREDVAGLYSFQPVGTEDPIGLIEKSIAAADAAPRSLPMLDQTRAPKAYYWYRALRFADEAPGRRDDDRFAFCAVPAAPRPELHVYVMAQDRVIYRRTWSGTSDTPTTYPSPSELAARWESVD